MKITQDVLMSTTIRPFGICYECVIEIVAARPNNKSLT